MAKNKKIILTDTYLEQYKNQKYNEVYDSIRSIDSTTVSKERTLEIAKLFDRAQDFVKTLSSTEIYKGRQSDKFTPPSTIKEQTGIMQTYNRLMPEFFDVLNKTVADSTGKYSTGSSLIKNVVNLNSLNSNIKFAYTPYKINGNPESLMHAANAVKNAITNGQTFATYDTETLGGNNMFGYKTFDGMTEFAFGLHNYDANGKLNSKWISNVIGISDDEFKAYQEELSGIESNGLNSDRLRVLANRFGFYGHDDTVLNQVKNSNGVIDGSMWEVAKAVDPKAEGLSNIATIRQGMQKLNNVYHAQQAAADANGGVYEWQNQMIEMAQIMHGTHPSLGNIPIVNQNGMKADNPWFNLMLASDKMKNRRADLLNALGQAGKEVPSITMNSSRQLDMLSLMRLHSSIYGKNWLYQNVDTGNGVQSNLQLLMKNTQFSQEAIENLLFGGAKDGEQHHMAQADARNLAMMASTKVNINGKSQTLLESLTEGIAQKKFDVANYTGDAQHLFLADKTYRFNSYDTGNALGFVQDKGSNTIRTFNGYEISKKDGKITTRRQSFGQNGIKRNVPFTIDGIQKFDTTDEFLKLMHPGDAAKDIHPELAQGQLFAVNLKYVYDKGTANGATLGLDSPITYIFKSQDELEGFMSSFKHIGTRSNTNLGEGETIYNTSKAWVATDTAVRDPELAVKNITQYGVQDVDGFNVDYAVKRGTEQSLNESSARMAREFKYSHVEDFRHLQKKLVEEYTTVHPKAVGTKYVTPKIADVAISSLIAKGDPLTLQLQKELGFEYNGQSNLYRETVDKMVGAVGYMQSQSGFYDLFDKTIDGMGFDRSNKEKLNYAFQRSMAAARDTIVSGYEDMSPNAQARLLQNARDMGVYAKDLNYMEFDISGLAESLQRRSRSSKIGDSSLDFLTQDNVVRVNLGQNGEYGLLDSLFDARFASPLASKEGAQGLGILKQFMKTANKQYNGIFDDVNANEYDNAKILAETLRQKMADYRTDNPTAGYIKPLNIQSAITPDVLLQKINEGGLRADSPEYEELMSKVTAAMTKEIKSTPSTMEFMTKDPTYYSTVADKIVDNVMFRFGKSDIEKEIAKGRYSEAEAEGLHETYKSLRTDMHEYVSNFIAGVANVDADLAFDPVQKFVQIMKGHESTVADLPQVHFVDGKMYIQVGSNKVAAHLGLDLRDAVPKRGNQGIAVEKAAKLRSSFGLASRDAINPYYGFKRASVDRRDILAQVGSNIASLNQKLRGLSTVDEMDAAAKASMFKFDFNDIVHALPEIMASGRIKIDKNYRDTFMDVMQRAMNSDTRIEDFEHLTAAQRETLAKAVPSILSQIADMKGNSTLKSIVGNLTNLLSEKGVSAGFMQIGIHGLAPGMQYLNNKRPPTTQTAHEIMYDAKQWKNAIKNIKGLSVGPLLGDEHTNAEWTRDVQGVEMSTAVSGKYLNMSESQFKEAMLKEYENGDIFDKALAHVGAMNGTSDDAKRHIYNIIKGTNLHDQEFIVDTRVMEDIFNKMDIQTINAKKMVQVNHSSNLEALKEIENFSKILPVVSSNGQIEFKYSRGIDVKRSQKLLRTEGYGGVENVFGAKYDGIYKFGVFTQNGVLVHEDKINEILKAKSVKGIDDAVSILENEGFNAKFYVTRKKMADYNKITLGFGEKGEGFAPFVGAGTVSNDVKKFLMKNGHAHDVGVVLSDDYIKDIIHRNGHGNREASILAMFRKERNLAGDVIRGFTGEDTHFILNHDIAGHQNSMIGVESTVGLIMDSAKNKKETAGKIVNEVFNGKALYDPKTGKFTLPRQFAGGQDNINIDALGDIAEKLGLKYNVGDKEYLGKAFLQDGKAIGSYGYGYFIQTKDWPGGTGVGILNERKYLNKHKDLLDESSELYKVHQENLDDIFANLTGKEKKIALRAEKQKYRNKRNLIKQEIAQNQEARSIQSELERQKGLKISERTLTIAGNRHYDDESLQLMKEKLKSPEEFERYAGFATVKDEAGNIRWKDEYKGKSILGDYLDSVKSLTMTGHNELNLFDVYNEKEHIAGMSESEIKRLEAETPGAFRLSERNGYLLDHFKVAKNTNAVVIKDPHVRALLGGNDFSNLSISKAEDILAFGQGVHAVRFNAGELTPEEIKARGFSSKKIQDMQLSVEGMADEVLNHKDNPYNHSGVWDLGEDFADKDRYLALPATPTRVSGDDYVKHNFQKELNTLQSRQREYHAAKVGGVKEGQDINDLKANYLKQAQKVKSVLEDDVSNKGSLFSNLTSVRLDQSHTGKASTVALSLPKDSESFAKANYEALSVATFEGKTLAQHASEGRIIDSVFKSRADLEKMGMFSEEYMGKTFKGTAHENIGIEAQKEVMAGLLREKGTMALTTRFPEIEEGSVKPTMLYLDDLLTENRTKFMGVTQRSAGGDNDGDTLITALMKNKQGKDYLYSQLHENELTSKHMFNQVKLSIMDRAIGVNTNWEAAVQKDMKEGIDKAFANGDVRKITEGYRISGKLYAQLDKNPNMNSMIGHMDNIDKIRKTVLEQANLKSVDKLEDRQKFLETAVAHIDKTFSGDEHKNMMNSLIQDEVFRLSEEQTMAKAKKLSIGEVNTPWFRTRRVRDLLLNTGEDKATLKSAIIQNMAHLSEQESISAKKGSDRYYTTKTKELSEAINKIMYSSKPDDVTQGLKNLTGWMEQNAGHKKVAEKARLIASSMPSFEKEISGKTDEQITHITLNYFKDAMKSLNNGGQTEQLKEYLKLGQGLHGVSGKSMYQALKVVGEGTSFTDMALRTAHAARVLDTQFVQMEKRDVKDNLISSLSDGREWLKNEEKESGQTVKKMIQSVGEKFSKVKGEGLAMGALAVAGGLMAAGFVGGNPARAAGTQASEDADASDFYSIPSMMDQGNIPGHTQQGYTINIDANTRHGSKRVQQIINQAMSQSMPVDVNVAMNIKDSAGNITDRKIEDMITGAFN